MSLCKYDNSNQRLERADEEDGLVLFSYMNKSLVFWFLASHSGRNKKTDLERADEDDGRVVFAVLCCFVFSLQPTKKNRKEKQQKQRGLERADEDDRLVLFIYFWAGSVFEATQPPGIRITRPPVHPFPSVFFFFRRRCCPIGQDRGPVLMWLWWSKP